MLNLDWFEATLECDILEVLGLCAVLSQSTGEPTKERITTGRGKHGYKRSHKVNGDDFELTILDLGTDGWPHIIGSGASANIARQISRALGCAGRVSRIDIACDSLEGWLPAEGRALKWADEHPKTAIIHMGDIYRQERGRTIYIGAPSSERRIRIYEKGIQTGGEPNWVRVELQYRPNNRNAKAWAFESSMQDIADSSRAFVALRAEAGLYSPPAYQRPERQPLLALAHQYGNVLREHVPDAWRIIQHYIQREWKP